MKFQVILKNQADQVFDTIRPTLEQAYFRLADHLSNFDEYWLISADLRSMATSEVDCCGVIGMLNAHGFEVTIKNLK